MQLADLVANGAVLASLRGANKKNVLHGMCERAAALSGLDARELLDAVLQRERLGSTGVGNGIAIPHGKLARCGRIFGVFARLEKAIEFEAVDGELVDLVFLLITSATAGADHLKALARVARFLRDPKITTKLRASRDADVLHAVLMQASQASHAA